jgi:hypothetical protein
VRTRFLQTAALVALCAGAVRPAARAEDTSASVPFDLQCPLCQVVAGAPVVHLTAAVVDSLGLAYADDNEGMLARLDSLYRAGRFGPPGSRGAREAVQLAARLATRNAYSYVADFAIDSSRVYEADEAALVHAFSTFTDPGLYPITRLRRARMGFGWVCLQYDLGRDLDTLATMGGKRVRVRTRDVVAAGEHRRMLSMMLPTGLDDMVEVMVPEHYVCRVEHARIEGPPAPYELFLLHDIRGLLLRKWGTHSPRAIMFWTTPRDRALDASAADALVGVRIYVPELHLRVPFLPDLGFDDLREIDLPQPIVRLDYVRAATHPDWLDGRATGFDGWSGHGPVPPVVRERFPDH